MGKKNQDIHRTAIQSILFSIDKIQREMQKTEKIEELWRFTEIIKSLTSCIVDIERIYKRR